MEKNQRGIQNLGENYRQHKCIAIPLDTFTKLVKDLTNESIVYDGHRLTVISDGSTLTSEPQKNSLVIHNALEKHFNVHLKTIHTAPIEYARFTAVWIAYQEKE